jgi:phosphonate transport system substrate-binding protein
MDRAFRSLWLRCTAVLMLALTAGLTSCKSGASKDGRPTVLRYAFAPASEQLQNANVRADRIAAYLTKQLHIPVEVVRVEGYGPTIEAMRAHKVDIAGFGSLSYIIASQKADAQAIIARGFPDGSIGGYRSVIAVPKDSPIHSMADLKAHAKDIVFAFSDPASTSGNLYPRVGLLKAGIDPEKDFKKVLFAGTHPETAMAIEAGKVDAGGYMASVGDTLVFNHKIPPDSLRVIWTSDLIPNSCTAVRKDLPEDLKHKIQQAFIDLPKNDPELAATLTKTYGRLASGTEWVRVNDATYNGLRDYAAQVKDFNFVEGK